MKKTALLSFIFICFFQFLYSYGNASVVNKGDLNCDGSVGLDDGILALQLLSGFIPAEIGSNYESSGADVNNDGRIGLEEPLYILHLLSDLRVVPPTPNYKLRGINFSPYRRGQNPENHTDISIGQIRERMSIIAPYVDSVRSFDSDYGLENTCKVAHEYGLKCYGGVWLDTDTAANDKRIAKLIAAGKAGYLDAAIVGSEVLFRNDVFQNDLKETELISYINTVKSQLPGIPVTTGDIYGSILQHPDVIAACDFLFINIYPYWESLKLEYAVARLHTSYHQVVEAANGKEVIISETGWPSCGNVVGEAVPSMQNAKQYFMNFVSWARSENVKYFYFEAFDEEWKVLREGPQGACWGLWDKEGKMKSGMQDIFDGQTMPDNWTCQAPPGGDKGAPTIEFTYVPPYGIFEKLQGQVWHVPPREYNVVVYIYVLGFWIIKPSYAEPTTSINCDGTFTVNFITGGVDQNADKIVAYLCPKSFELPDVHAYAPDVLEANCKAKVEVARSH